MKPSSVLALCTAGRVTCFARYEARRRALLVWRNGETPIEVPIGVLAAFGITMDEVRDACTAYRLQNGMQLPTKKHSDAKKAKERDRDRKRKRRKVRLSVPHRMLDPEPVAEIACQVAAQGTEEP